MIRGVQCSLRTHHRDLDDLSARNEAMVAAFAGGRRVDI
jgi:hypothetical protein